MNGWWKSPLVSTILDLIDDDNDDDDDDFWDYDHWSSIVWHIFLRWS